MVNGITQYCRDKLLMLLCNASLTHGDPDELRKIKIQPGDLPTGLLVGTVEIADCTGSPGNYNWILKNPERLQQGLKPKNHPQPVWFYPF